MTINLSRLFASGAFPVEFEFLPASTAWVAPRDCTVRITSFGGSASGGAIRTSGNTGSATGGGAGARSTKTVKLKAGDVLTITIGAGGAGVIGSIAGTAVDGNDGGDTTVTGPNGLSIVAGGGKKGLASNLANLILNGGAGGIATGGDENVSGGRGGNITTASPNNRKAVTGGGALPLKQTGYRGGDIYSSAIAASDYATGGAGIGGNGADINQTNSVATAGGGTHTAGDVAKAISAFSTEIQFTTWLRASSLGGPNISGSGPTVGADGGTGAGSGAVSTTSTGNATVGAAGAFAGGGAVLANGTGATFANSKMLTYGGSGGALAAGASAYTAPGGRGLVVLEIA